jgi:hypothetical protein
MIIPLAILIAIGFASGLTIYLVSNRIQQKVRGLEKMQEIKSILPEINCGACGHPSCFGYAQALIHDFTLARKHHVLHYSKTLKACKSWKRLLISTGTLLNCIRRLLFTLAATRRWFLTILALKRARLQVSF